MCDFSLQNAKSRPAVVGDKLQTRDFMTGTRGFCDPADKETAVCVLPGTELAFDKDITSIGGDAFFWSTKSTTGHKTARFRQINKDQERMHHDALELPDGQVVMLTYLLPGQHATVLQLPATPRNEAEAEEQRRLEVVG